MEQVHAAGTCRTSFYEVLLFRVEGAAKLNLSPVTFIVMRSI